MKKIWFLTLLLFLIPAKHPMAKNWFVNPQGTGDAPTIQAAVDSASSGDNILVDGGNYYEEIIVDGKSVNLYSSSGIPVLIAPAPGSGTGITFENISAGNSLWSFTIKGYSKAVRVNNASTEIMFLSIEDCSTGLEVAGVDSSPLIATNFVDSCLTACRVLDGTMIEFMNHTIVNCDYGIVVEGGEVSIERNIVFGCDTGIYCTGGSISLYCNDLWANSTDYSGCSQGATDLHEDPMFCYQTDDSPGLYYLHRDSPCWAENNSCGNIGTFTSVIGCTGTSTGNSSWGSIKSMYR